MMKSSSLRSILWRTQMRNNHSPRQPGWNIYGRLLFGQRKPPATSGAIVWNERETRFGFANKTEGDVPADPAAAGETQRKQPTALPEELISYQDLLAEEKRRNAEIMAEKDRVIAEKDRVIAEVKRLNAEEKRRDAKETRRNAKEKRRNAKEKRRIAKENLLKVFDTSTLVAPLEVVLPRDNALLIPTFVSEPDWLEKIGDTIFTNMDKEDTGAERVPPVALVRFSRGGKTRSLHEIAAFLREHSPQTAVIFVTFNDYSEIEPWEQEDPLGALCRRIAFAAIPRRDYFESSQQYIETLKSCRVDPSSIVAWLAKQEQCVLLIDELNQVAGLNENDFDPQLKSRLELMVKFIKLNFLKKRGRYLVFSSHVVSTRTTLSDYMDALSGRKVFAPQLPLIPSLKIASTKLGILTLTGREALFCGKSPALIITRYRDGVLPDGKRVKIVEDWIKEGVTERDILTLLESLLNGRSGLVPVPLLQFTDSTEIGLVHWIPFHMVFVLKEIIDGIKKGKIKSRLKMQLERLVALFAKFEDSKTSSGDDWEALFVLVLLVRCLTGSFDKVLTADFEPDLDVQYTVTFNSPLQIESTGPIFENMKNLDELLTAIPISVMGKGRPQIAIYYPKHASFEAVDVLVVGWNTAGKRFAVVGYQLKVGKGKGKITAKTSLCDKIFLIKGDAAKMRSTQDDWIVPSEEEISAFFGVSGQEWTPKRWKELNDQK